MSSLLFKLGSTVRLTNSLGIHRTFVVRERQRSGYLLEPSDSPGERLFHSDDLILEHYALRRLIYSPVDVGQLSDVRRERAKKQWEALSPAKRRIAERRQLIVKRIMKEIQAGVSVGTAMEVVPGEVVAEYAAEWAKQDYAAAEEKFNRQKATGTKMEPGAEPQPAAPFRAPKSRTAWEWCHRYIEMGENVVALAPYSERQGNRKQLSADVERAMEVFIDELVERKLIGRSVAALHKALKLRLMGQGLTAPSVPTFTKRLNSRVTYYESTVARLGKRAADERRNIAEYVPDPDWVLQQVEIDHTLANIHLICNVTGVNLRRPWITVVLDRLSRVILGCHVSFLPPSWATLSRAVAHAIWLKDLSKFPGLAGKWDHHGVFDCAYTDRGMDFISNSARRAGDFVGFDIANLPGFSPWLKGKVERVFGTMALQCFNYRDGITALKNPDYNPVKNASVTVNQFKADLLEWIVEYNHRAHGGLVGGCSPNDVWEASVAQRGGVQPVRTVSSLRRLIGKSAFPKLTNQGLRVLGLDYFCPRMVELRELYDTAGKRFEVRYDPYDLRSIEFFDGNDWYEAHARRPDVAAGVTAWQHFYHLKIAKARSNSDIITADMIARIREGCVEDLDHLRHSLGRSKLRTNAHHLSRYLDVGQFLTPVSFVGEPLRPPPLLIPGATQLTDGRFAIAPDPSALPALPAPATDHTSAHTAAPALPAPTQPAPPSAPSCNGPPASEAVDERLLAKLEARRKTRGAR